MILPGNIEDRVEYCRVYGDHGTPTPVRHNRYWMTGEYCWFAWMSSDGVGVLFRGDGADLVFRWTKTSPSVDALISGVLADWMEDNRDALLSDNPADRIDSVVAALRKRYSHILHGGGFS